MTSIYEKIKRLGGDYFSDVWLERDVALGRECVVKYLDPSLLDPNVDLYAEAQLMREAHHPNVAEIFSADFVDGRPVIRMEYLPEGSVAGRCGGTSIPPLEAMRILEATCRGVQHLHDKGLLHRDIKPANLLLTVRGDVKVADFGLARRVGLNEESRFNYTIHLPPEAIGDPLGISTVQGDIYALGVTAYRLLNGDDIALADVTNFQELPTAIVEGTFPDRNFWLPHVHSRLRRAVKKALHEDPSKRFSSATDFRHALEGARPLVAWSSSPDAPYSWLGEQGNVSWLMRLEEIGGSYRRLVLMRRTGGGQLRRRREDCSDLETESEALKTATRLLDRLAERGN